MTIERPATARASISALFAELGALDEGAQRGALAQLALPATERALLEALLTADRSDHDPLAASLVQAARRTAGESEPVADIAGRRIGAWQVVREVGAGGMGTVFLVKRAAGDFQMAAALKLLRGFPTREATRRLAQERQILAALDHPNIARLIDGGETGDGQPFIVLEFVDGLALDAYVARSALDVRARLALFDRVAAAVAHAHQRLVIHRDLKPANILVRADGEPKLLDFGVAKLVDIADEGASEESTRVSSRGFSSPEQLAGRAVGTATDTYSLGIVLRRMLDAGAGVRREAGAFELDAVVARATADDPGARYPSVDALRDDIARWLDGRALRAVAGSRRYRVTKFATRHRLALALTALALVATGLFIAGLAIAVEQARRAEAEALAARAAAEHEAQVAGRIGDFMVGIFQRANTSLTDGAPVNARDLLDRATVDLIADEALDGATRAVLLERVASASIGLGDLDGAARALARADRLAAALDPELRARLEYTGARIATRQNDLARARALSDSAQARIDALADGEPLRVQLLQQRMFIENRAGDYRRALVLADQALAAWRATGDADPTVRVRILNSRAVAEYALGDTAATIATMRENFRASAADPRIARADHVQTGLNLITSLIDLDELGEARAVIADIEPIARRLYRSDNTAELARVLREKGELALASSDSDAALAAFDEAVAIADASPIGAAIAESVRRSRSEALLALDRLGEAEADLRAAVGTAGWTTPAPGGDPDLGVLYAIRGRIACRRGDAAAVARDADAARVIASGFPATSVERRNIERRVDRLVAGCRDRPSDSPDPKRRERS